VSLGRYAYFTAAKVLYTERATGSTCAGRSLAQPLAFLPKIRADHRDERAIVGRPALSAVTVFEGLPEFEREP